MVLLTTFSNYPALIRPHIRQSVSALLLLTATTGQAQTPTVVSLSPARNARSAPRTTDVAVGFDQVLSNNAATLGALKVFSAQTGGRKAGTATVSGNTLSFNPNTDFKPGETVSATVTTAAQISGGQNLAAGQVFQFTTATNPSPGTFGGGSDNAILLLGGAPVVTVSADVDNDNNLDLLTASNNTVRISLNNGNGTFRGGSTVAVAAAVQDMAVADVDGDGDLDFVTIPVSTGGPSTVSVRLNNGNGTFSNGPDVSVFGQPLAVVFGDTDGDGDLDLLVSTAQGVGSVDTAVNDGTGRFTVDYTRSVIARTSTDLALGDVDNDGDLDLFALYTADSYVNLALNNGNGTFEYPRAIRVSGQPGKLTVGDLDGDGDLDFVTTSPGNNISLRFNNGGAAFTNQELPLSSTPNEVALGDVDGDGDLDLLVALTSGSTGRVGVRLNNGSGNFAAVGNPQEVTLSGLPNQIVLGDFDGTGTLDFVTTNTASNAVSIRFNQNQALLPTITSPAVTASVGTRLTITGTNFQNVLSVTFGGVVATEVTVNSLTQLVATVPVGARTGALIVTTSAGSSNSIGFTISVPLLVTAVTPTRNAPAAPRTTTVAMTFSEVLDNGGNTGESTLRALNVFSQQAGGKKLGTTVLLNNRILSFKPTTAFKPGEKVSATVTSAARSSFFVNARPHVFQFTTATAPSTGLFSGGTDLAIDSAPNAVATGDVDGDGDLDLLIAADGNGGTVSVRLNDGQGNFSAGQSLSVPPSASSVVLGDIDSDGDLDFLTVSSATSTISVRLNNGTGTFSGTQEFVAPTGTSTLALGDVDADGDLDLVTTSAVYGGVAGIFLNDRNGVFTSKQTIAPSDSGPHYGIALGDVDSDGDLDLFITNGDNSKVDLYLNDGRGTFANRRDVAVGTGPYSVELGDIDNDGDLDVVTSNGVYVNVRSVSVRFNDGQGNFSGTQELTIGNSPRRLALADVDGDGDLDVVTANQNSSSASVRLNNGAGIFSGTQEVSLANDPWSIVTGDVDGDGDVDLLTANTASNTVSVRLNQNPQAPSIISVAPNPAAVGQVVVISGTNFTGATSVTFNGVAEPTFVVNSPTQITVRVPVGATSGPLVVTTPAGASAAFSFTVAPSLLATTFTPARNASAAPRTTDVAVQFNQGLSTGDATRQALRVFSQQSGGKKAGNTTVNGNTLAFKPDSGFKPGETVFATLTTAAQNSSGTQNLGGAQVYQFTAATAPASGSFLPVADLPVGINPQSIATGDVDGDGDLDVVTANNRFNSTANGTVSVRLNNGSGTFSGTQEVAVGRGPYMVVLADVDSDGDLDLLTANASSSSYNNAPDGTVSVRLNNGSGVFSGAQEVAVGSNPHAIAVGDVDGDGDLDLLAANYTAYLNFALDVQSTVSVRLNTGNGIFSNTGQQVLVGPRPINIVLGDVDSDGDLDFATTSSSQSAVSLRLNDGNGVFSGVQEVAVGNGPHGLAFGDLDKDGDLDLVTANFYNFLGGVSASSSISVRLNDGQGRFTGTQNIPSGLGARFLTLGDVNGDGSLDVLAVNSDAASNSVSLLLNNGSGTLSSTPPVAVGSQPASLALGDLDGDGTLDFVTANYTANNVSVRLNQTTAPRVLAAKASGVAEQISLFPNPAHATVRLLLPGYLAQQALHVSLVNTLGQTVLTRQFTPKQLLSAPALDLGSLTVGVYTVRLRTSEGVVSKRLVVE